MAFADWTDFTAEFRSTFCPENEATSALMHLESDRYFQGQQNVEAYIDEFRDLVNMSGYTDPIAIVLKFCRGLNPTMQDKIAELGTDRPRDNDHQGWYAAARQFDLNRVANEAFRYASRRPTVQSTTHHSAVDDASQCSRRRPTVQSTTPHSAVDDVPQCSRRRLTVQSTTSHSAVDDAPICQLYSHVHPVLILPPGHLVDPVPCIHAHPYEAIPPGSTPSRPRKH
jgi:hypothetical protein